MDIDWALAVFFFIVFAVWSFSYLGAVLPKETHVPAEAVFRKAIEAVTVREYSIPARFYSNSSSSGAALYAVMDWLDGNPNTTRVYSGTEQLPCEISGDTLLWLSDLSPGDNDFTITFSTEREPMNCSASIPRQANLTLSGVTEARTSLSIESLNSLLLKDYNLFREENGINTDIRIEADIGTESYAFGPVPPYYADIHSSERTLPVSGTTETATLRVLVWNR